MSDETQDIAAQLPVGDSSWHELLLQIQTGDSDALASLYDLSSRIVYSVAVRILNNAPDAEEVTADVYAYVWKSAASYNSARGTVSTWLTMLTRSRALGRLRSADAQNGNHCNHRDTVERLPLQSSVLACNGSIPSCDQQILVQNALNGLTGVERDLIELAFFSGLSHPELASRLNLPLGTVKGRIRTALLRMRDLIR